MSPGSIDRLVLVAPAGLKPERGEILDVFYSPAAAAARLNVHDPKSVPEWDELFGRRRRRPSWRSPSATGRCRRG